jgi:RNA 2',3'-cyclic 3'-phosphodiesterase
VRLFVAVWPTDLVRDRIAGTIETQSTDQLRWVKPENWHVTLAFLGSVPDDELDALVAGLRSIQSQALRCAAALGTHTSTMGRSVLCLPTTGLDELAGAVRESTEPFSRAPDRDRPFAGHLTLARARRGRAVPDLAVGQPVSGPDIGAPVSMTWPVSEVRLVASEEGRQGTEYSPQAVVALAR